MRRRQERGKSKKYFWWGLGIVIVALSVYVPTSKQKQIEKTLPIETVK